MDQYSGYIHNLGGQIDSKTAVFYLNEESWWAQSVYRTVEKYPVYMYSQI